MKNFFFDKVIRANFYDGEILLLTDFIITIVSVETYRKVNRFVRLFFVLFALIMFLLFIIAAAFITLQVFGIAKPLDLAYSDIRPSPFFLILAAICLLIAIWQLSAVRWMVRNISAARR